MSSISSPDVGLVATLNPLVHGVEAKEHQVTIRKFADLQRPQPVQYSPPLNNDGVDVPGASATVAQVAITAAHAQPSLLVAFQQELTETLDTTREKAVQGDQVAIRKLAALDRTERIRLAAQRQNAGVIAKALNATAELFAASTRTHGLDMVA